MVNQFENVLQSIDLQNQELAFKLYELSTKSFNNDVDFILNFQKQIINDCSNLSTEIINNFLKITDRIISFMNLLSKN